MKPAAPSHSKRSPFPAAPPRHSRQKPQPSERFPGSCNPAATTISGDFPLATCSRENAGAATKAAIPCGDSVVTALENTSAGNSRISAFPAIPNPPSSSSEPLRTKTVSTRSPLRSASSTRCRPSTATSPDAVFSLFFSAARKSFTRAFCRLCTMRICAWFEASCMGVILP